MDSIQLLWDFVEFKRRNKKGVRKEREVGFQLIQVYWVLLDCREVLVSSLPS